MTLYEISGNEIHGKEVVFKTYISVHEKEFNSFTMFQPDEFDILVYLGNDMGKYVFHAYDSYNKELPFLYLGHLKDKI